MAVVSSRRTSGRRTQIPVQLDRRFEAVVFDWDGTAVPDRRADAAVLRGLVEELCARGMTLAVVTGTHVDNVDDQLRARPAGPGALYLCVNRGSEVYRAVEDGVRLLHRRDATPAENSALDAAAAATVAELAHRGLGTEVVSERLNRRKIDLIPLPEWTEPPKARIGELLAVVEERLRDAGLRGLGDAVGVALASARAAELDAKVTSDGKYLEIGLTDKSDAAQWVWAALARVGIDPRLTLVVGDEFGPLGGLPGSDSFLLVPEAAAATAVSVGAEPTGAPTDVVALGGGPAAFRRLLADQLARRRRGDVPEPSGDPRWTLAVEGFDPSLERVHESLLALADGRLGTRGVSLVGDGATRPGIVLAGVYDGAGAETSLARCADWARVADSHEILPDVRRLDLHSCLLHEAGAVTSLRFSSLARPGTVALRAAAGPGLLPAAVQGRAEAGAAVWRDRRRGRILERLGAYDARIPAARAALAAAEEAGFERLLNEHRAAWARRWEEADVTIVGDPELQFAVRFALFHLMASVGDRGEAAVGARGLSGPAYGGHVFWDSDVFVLPFLAATHPAAARAMLEYRIRRLPQARAAAARSGRSGARFPWESAGEGADVTPTAARTPDGRVVRIRTGELEEHIAADVAWAASCYGEWTGDAAFLTGPGGELVVETARYWASRIRYDGDGRAHLYGVIGPDEYHEPVDDNAFTNVMARWNLRRAAEVDGVDPDERRGWLAAADALVDGYDPVTRIYEQFAGFYELEPLLISEAVPRRPVAADLLLGADRVAAAQVVKQADVLMLHQLVPGEVAPGSLVPNLDFYEPRTAHGSSLSPAVHAGLQARADRFSAALESLRLAARIDLDDLTGTTAGGLHLATMGGLWQALAFGFAGVRPSPDRVLVDPRLPPEWEALELGLRFHGDPFRLRIEPGRVAVTSGPLTARRRDHFWEVVRK
jgi:trehalose/maltose hydrolase-like predicted phosphorylase